MTQRIAYFQVSQKLSGKLYELSGLLQTEFKDHSLYELVHILASVRNGCAFCLDMGVKKSRQMKIDEMKVFHVATWRDSPLFDAREKAAFEWTEAITHLSAEGISDELYDRLRVHFSEKELSDLTIAISTVNVWNRLNVAFRGVPGSMDEMLGLKGK